MIETGELKEKVHFLVPEVNHVNQQAVEVTRSLGVWTRHRFVKLSMAMVDLVSVTAAMLVAHSIRSLFPDRAAASALSLQLLVGGLSLPLWLAVLWRYRLYAARHVTSLKEEWSRVSHAVMAGSLAMAAASFMLHRQVARGWILATAILSFAFLLTERGMVRLLFARFRAQRKRLRRVVVVGANIEGQSIAQTLRESPSLGYEVVGFVDDDVSRGSSFGGLTVLGRVEEAEEVVHATGANGVIIAPTATTSIMTNQVIRRLADAGIHVELSSSLRDIHHARISVRPVGPFAILSVTAVHRQGWQVAAKRGLDVAAAALLLTLVTPLLAIVAVLVRVDSPGPVLFRQRRVGHDGSTFSLLKVRSMQEGAENHLVELLPANEALGPLFKMRDDPRITRLGRWLRRWSIDEIPQLWNVIKGDMSLVGPRPALPEELSGWTPELFQRLRVRPGITGMWQVKARSASRSDDYLRLDLFYVDNWSLLSDLAILAQTVPAVISRRGAF